MAALYCVEVNIDYRHKYKIHLPFDSVLLKLICFFVIL